MNKHVLMVLILGGYYSFLGLTAYTFDRVFNKGNVESHIKRVYDRC